jgi:HSP20 family protein
MTTRNARTEAMAEKDVATKKESGAPAPRGETHPFQSLQRRMNELFDDVWSDFRFPALEWPFSNQSRFMPKVNVEQDGKLLRIHAELPGMEEKDIHVTLNDDVLTISGERKTEKEEKDKNFLRREFSYGSFHRAIPVPPNVAADKVKATFKNGVLSVELPLPEAEAPKSKRIEVKGS